MIESPGSRDSLPEVSASRRQAAFAVLGLFGTAYAAMQLPSSLCYECEVST